MPKSPFSEAYVSMLETLVTARKRAGVSQVELAKRLSKPQPFISKVERGVRRIDVIEFYAIARALRVDPEELFRVVVKKLPKSVEI